MNLTVVKGMTVLAVVAACGAAGYVLGSLLSPIYHNRNFPWIVARASGIGAFLALGLLCIVGVVFRRAPTNRFRWHAETLLRVHVALGPAVMMLIVAHVASLLADRYSGVSWRSLVVPNSATYRPGAVTYGMLAALTILMVFLTAVLAGRWGLGRRWVVVHKLAYPAFGLTWVHGVLVGSDTSALLALYLVVGALVLAATISMLVRTPVSQRIRTVE